MRRNLRICGSSSMTKIVAVWLMVSNQNPGKKEGSSSLAFQARLSRQWQEQGDARAPPFNALGDADTPTVCADHALANRQAQARALPAAITAGGGIEHIENLRALVFGNPRPFIGYRKKQLVIRHARAHLQTALGG